MATTRYSNALAYRPYGPTPGVYGGVGPSNALAAMVNSRAPSNVASVAPTPNYTPFTPLPLQQMPAAQTYAPPMPAQPQTPLSVGSVPFFDPHSDGGQAGSNAVGAANEPDNQVEGVAQTSVDALSNFSGGIPGMGGFMGALGSLGGPVTGVLGAAAGTIADLSFANSALSQLGLDPIDAEAAFGIGKDAALNGVTGTALQDAVNSSLGTLGYAGVAGDILGAQLANPETPQGVAQMGAYGGAYGAVADPMGSANAALGGFDNVSGAIGGLFGGVDDGFGGMQGGFTGGGFGGFGGGEGYGSASDNDASGAGGYGPDGMGSGGMGAGAGPDGPGSQWYTGGFTGYGADNLLDPYAPAGTVHEGEIVIPAHQVERYGRNALMRYVNGTAPASAPARYEPGAAPSARPLIRETVDTTDRPGQGPPARVTVDKSLAHTLQGDGPKGLGAWSNGGVMPDEAPQSGNGQWRLRSDLPLSRSAPPSSTSAPEGSGAIPRPTRAAKRPNRPSAGKGSGDWVTGADVKRAWGKSQRGEGA